MSNPEVVHSKLSFSGRKRWRLCPASVALSEGAPDNSNPAAAEGTAAHTVGEFYIRQHFDLPGGAPRDQDAPVVAPPEGLDLSKYGATPHEQLAAWNAELRKHGKAYRDFVISLIPPGEQAFVDVEQKVSLPSIHPLLFGTLDLRIWFPRQKWLTIVDYKFGFQDVEIGTADDPNAQLAAYATGSMEGATVKPEGYTLAVFQPRVPLGDPAKILHLPKEWLEQERAKLRVEVAAVGNPGEPRPGDHCRYCKGAGRCPAVHNAARAALAIADGHANLLAMSDDELVQVWAAKTAFKNFWEDVEERIVKLAERGHAGLEIKETQGRRMWADTRTATLTLLAMGRTDLLQPVALSDAIAHIPNALQDELVKRSRPARSIQTLPMPGAGVIADVFKKYAKIT